MHLILATVQRGGSHYHAILQKRKLSFKGAQWLVQEHLSPSSEDRIDSGSDTKVQALSELSQGACPSVSSNDTLYSEWTVWCDGKDSEPADETQLLVLLPSLVTSESFTVSVLHIPIKIRKAVWCREIEGLFGLKELSPASYYVISNKFLNLSKPQFSVL